MNATASLKETTPKTIIATAPKNAADGRSMLSLGSRVKIIPRKVIMKIITAVVVIVIKC